MENISLYSIKKEKIQGFESIQIKSSKDAADFARLFYGDDLGIYESVFIICLNNANKVTGYAKISQGGCCASVIDANIVGKYAIDTLSKGIIMIHNHPSGTLRPSPQDEAITRKIAGMLSNFTESRLLDHVILTEDSFYSFSDNGLI